MLVEEMIDFICKGFCKYYKGEKDEATSCEGLKFASRLLMKDGAVLDKIEFPTSNFQVQISNYQRDGLLKVILCERCEFQIDGCDFRGWNGDMVRPLPCGGYLFLDYLLDHGILKEEEISNG